MATDFEVLLERAAEGAETLQEVDRRGQDAAEDIRDSRSQLAGLRLAIQTALQTAARLITTGLLLAPMAGVAGEIMTFGALR